MESAFSKQYLVAKFAANIIRHESRAKRWQGAGWFRLQFDFES